MLPFCHICIQCCERCEGRSVLLELKANWFSSSSSPSQNKWLWSLPLRGDNNYYQTNSVGILYPVVPQLLWWWWSTSYAPKFSTCLPAKGTTSAENVTWPWNSRSYWQHAKQILVIHLLIMLCQSPVKWFYHFDGAWQHFHWIVECFFVGQSMK